MNLTGPADQDPQRSLHQQILEDIENRIMSGDWGPGHRIPFEHDLAETYGCSRMTVNKALTQLARSGLIERRRKSGSFVAQPMSQTAVLDIHDIKAEVLALGLAYSFRIVARSERTAKAEDRRRLIVERGERVLALHCLHLAGDKPFCLEDRLISLSAVPEAHDESFATLSPSPWLVARVPWSSAEHRIRAINADPELARTLGLDSGDACLVIERRTSRNGEDITQVRLTYPGKTHELVASFTPNQGR